MGPDAKAVGLGPSHMDGPRKYRTGDAATVRTSRSDRASDSRIRYRAASARGGAASAGRIRFGITPTLGPYVMPGVIADLHRENPELRLFIKEGIPSLQMAELADGKLDMMVAPLPVVGDMFELEPLFREPMHIVAPPDHQLAMRKNLSEKDLAGATFLSLDHRHHYHAQVQTICTRVGAHILGDYEGTSLDSLRQMAGSGVGLAILPELYVRSESGGTEMVTGLRPKDPSIERLLTELPTTGAD